MARVRLTQALRDEYHNLWDSCQIRRERLAAVDALVTRIKATRPRYETIQTALGVPWSVVAALHALEASLSFRRHLHNGDPLTARTVRVPVGRPAAGEPPFSWEDSAADALTLRRLHRVSDWTLPGMLYQLEAYNGWGYRLNHPQVKSPYLWCFSNHYTRGKYVSDGRWSDTAVSQQCGAAVLLRRMAERRFISPSSAVQS